MIPVKSNLGSLLRLWTRLYVDSRLNAAWRRGRKEEPSKEEWKRRSNRDSPSQFHRRLGHAQIQKADSESIGRRRRLILPTAQVGEFELEDIVKTRISRAGNNTKAVFSGSDASGRLLTAFLITLWSRRIEDCTNGQDPPINVNTFTLEQNFRSIELHRRSRPFCGDHVPIHTQAEGLCGFREQIISVSILKGWSFQPLKSRSGTCQRWARERRREALSMILSNIPCEWLREGRARIGVLIVLTTWRWLSWSCQTCYSLQVRACSSRGISLWRCSSNSWASPSKSWICIVDNRRRLPVYKPAAQTWKAASLCLNLNSRVAGYSHLLHTSHQLIQKRQAKQ